MTRGKRLGGWVAAMGAALLIQGCRSPRTPAIPLPPPGAPAPVRPPAPPPPPPTPVRETVLKPPPLTQPPPIRVWLSTISSAPEISVNGACRVTPAGATPRRHTRLGPMRVALVQGGFRLGEEFHKCSALEIQAEGDGQVHVEGRSYFGVVRFIRAGERLAVINVLDLERYLSGVLGSEMPANWPREALRAQAVAARTYALYYHLQRSALEWDLTATVEDQVYSGGHPPPSVSDAVGSTRGEVLTHDGGLFPAFFHSTCGGSTESPGRALGKAEFDFLEGVPCDYCRSSGHYAWRDRMRRTDMTSRLVAAGIPVSRVTGVSVVDSGPGIGKAVKVVWDGGETLVAMADFRRAVGRMTVRSGKFECATQGEEFVFTGHGLGHGAGLCQYGCRGMAEQKKPYREMLAYYYRNTSIEKLY